MFAAELESRLEKYCFPQLPSKRKITHTRSVQIGGCLKDVSFSVVQDEWRREAARDLLNDRYGWRGYGSAHDLLSDVHHTTFAAEIDGQVVGTMTLGVDSDDGLAIDSTFADVVGHARREPGAQICELTKLAFDETVRSAHVLAGLFHLAYIYGTTHTACTDLFIEVNPRHLRFYETMLGFQGVGPETTNMSVGAPSRLMRITVDAIRQNIRQLGGAPPSATSRSLYPYFFPPEEERQVRRLLRAAHFSIADRQDEIAEPVGRPLDAVIEDGAAKAKGSGVRDYLRSAA